IFVGAPQAGLLYMQMQAMGTGDLGTMATLSFAAFVINLIMGFILQGALTRAAVDDLSGSGVKFGAAIGDGLRFFFQLLIVGLLVGIGPKLGLLRFVLPGCVLAVRWSMTAPSVGSERAGPTAWRGRCAELASGLRLAICGLALLCLGFADALQIVFITVFSAF